MTIVSVRDTRCQIATEIHKIKQNQPALFQHRTTTQHLFLIVFDSNNASDTQEDLIEVPQLRQSQC